MAGLFEMRVALVLPTWARNQLSQLDTWMCSTQGRKLLCTHFCKLGRIWPMQQRRELLQGRCLHTNACKNLWPCPDIPEQISSKSRSHISTLQFIYWDQCLKAWYFILISRKIAVQLLSRTDSYLSTRDTTSFRLGTTSLFPSDRFSMPCKPWQPSSSLVPGHSSFLKANDQAVPVEVSPQICTVGVMFHWTHCSTTLACLISSSCFPHSQTFASWWVSHFQRHLLIERIAPLIPLFQTDLPYLFK